MKELFLAFVLILGCVGPLAAEIRHCPVYNIYYSVPYLPDVNQIDYNYHFFHCMQIQLDGYYTGLNNYTIGNQLIYYLQTVGTPTAFRLCADIIEVGLNNRLSSSFSLVCPPYLRSYYEQQRNQAYKKAGIKR